MQFAPWIRARIYKSVIARRITDSPKQSKNSPSLAESFAFDSPSLAEDKSLKFSTSLAEGARGWVKNPFLSLRDSHRESKQSNKNIKDIK